MSFSYPLSLPSTPAPAKVRMAPHAVVSVSQSPFTGTQQVQEFSGQWWSAVVTMPPMTRAQAEAWLAFLLRLNGRQGTFLLGDPAALAPRGVATGTPVVAGASQVGNVLVTSGWTHSVTGILLAGDYIQLGSGANAKLHKVLTDANSDGSGFATLDLWPSLQGSPTNGGAITVTNPVGLFRMSTNDMAWDADASKFFGFSFSCVGAL